MNPERSQPNRSTSTCDELRELLPDFAVGAATEEEARRVLALLPDCPEAAAELEPMLVAAGGLLESLTPMQPAAHVKDGLMARLAAEEATAGPAVPRPPARAAARPGRSRLAWAMAAAAGALLIVTNLYWYTQIQDVRAEVARLQTQPDVLMRLASAETRRIALETTSDAADVVATVFYDEVTGTATLFTDGLPALPSGQTYQVWLVRGKTPVSAGLFTTDEAGQGLYSFPANLVSVDAVAISVEPAGGSPAPTTAPIAVGAAA